MAFLPYHAYTRHKPWYLNIQDESAGSDPATNAIGDIGLSLSTPGAQGNRGSRQYHIRRFRSDARSGAGLLRMHIDEVG